MKSRSSFHVILRLYPLWICLVALTLIIHSCKKDNKVSQPVIPDAIVDQARQWYESNYAKATTRSTVRTQATGTAVQDWSKTFNPEWAKASKFMQDSLIFIELPALKKGDMAMSKKQMDPNKFDFSRSGNLTSLIIVNKKGAFYIYAMTILADSAYLKSDYGKIKNNTYRKRDKDFTGSVLYHRLDGSFVNGWRYINGAITGIINQIPVATSAARSLIHVSKQPKTATVACTTWLVTTYWEDCAYYSNDYSYANPFDCFSYTTESIFTSCSSVSSGGGTGSTSPPPCQIPTSAGTAVTASATKTLTRQVAPTGDGTVTGGIVDPTTQIGTSVTLCPTTPPPTPPDSSDCATAKRLTVMATNATLSKQGDTILNETTTTGIEYGTKLNLSNLTGGGYVPQPITAGTTSGWTIPTPTWDATHGYTIGFNHGHPGNTAPSPDDIFALATQINTNRELKAAGPTALQFYEAHAAVTAEADNGNYTVTVRDWPTVINYLTNNYGDPTQVTTVNKNYTSFASDYLKANPGASIGDATTYALMQLFGSAITVDFAAKGATTYTTLTFVMAPNGTYTVISTPCP
jgi:hypothetical protein